MDYEKAYKEALELARDYFKANQKIGESEENDMLSDIFPELKESERERDERIRKEIIAFIKKRDRSGCDYDYDKWLDWLEKQGSEPNWCHHKVDLSNCSEEYCKAYYDGWNNCNMQHSQCKSDGNDVVKCLINGMKFYYEDDEEATWGTDKFSMKVKDILSWLEKQGKTADKIEPKFKVGDWVVFKNKHQSIYQVEKIEDGYYILRHTHGGTFRVCILHDEDLRLWTIDDAKDGDVLTGKIDGDDYILIFKQIKDGWIETYGHYYNAVDRFCVPSQLFCRDYQGTLTPSTKEQRDLLFQKMRESGYEWDAEKKELKKIEKKPVVIIPKFKVGDKVYAIKNRFECTIESIDEITYYGDTTNFDIKDQDNWKLVEQKTAEWSEEDEKMYRMCVDAVEYYHTSEDEGAIRDWLKSLKDRVQPKQEWSEKDESFIKDLLNYFGNLVPLKHEMDDVVDWLETIEDKITTQKQEWNQIKNN